jgi:hypothetical protein
MRHAGLSHGSADTVNNGTVKGWQFDAGSAQATQWDERNLAAPLDFDPDWIESDQSLAFCLSMIFSENRFPLFGIVL